MNKTFTKGIIISITLMVVLLLGTTALAAAGDTIRVSLDSSDAEVIGDSFTPAISADGNVIAFVSTSDDLVSGDTNGVHDIFVRDVTAGTTVRVSVDSSGNESAYMSIRPDISADGDLVVFESYGNDLVSGDTNGSFDIFLHDMSTGETTIVSRNSIGGLAAGTSTTASISANGNFVVFRSDATNLVDGDTNGKIDIFLKNLSTGAVTRVSVDSSGTQANNDSNNPAVSGDGRFVVYDSVATNLVSGDTNGKSDVFVYDTATQTTTIVSGGYSTAEGNGEAYNPDISDNGRYIVFESSSNNMLWFYNDADYDIYLYDQVTAELGGIPTISVSQTSVGGACAGNSEYPAISGDGRFIAFHSYCPSIAQTSGDTNNAKDVFVYDRNTEHNYLMSLDSSATWGDGDSDAAAINYNGQFITYESESTNLVASDTNGDMDIFRHEHNYVTDVTAPTGIGFSINEYENTQPDTFTYKFSEEMYDPAGNSGAADVTNPDNWLLVNVTDGVLDSSCAGGVGGDDVQVGVDSVSYDDFYFRAAVDLTDALDEGTYSLLVCNLMDMNGVPKSNSGSNTFTIDVTDPAIDSTTLASSYTSSVSSYNFTFSESVVDDPPANSTGNTDNWLLVEAGPDEVIDTTSCSGGATNDDVAVLLSYISRVGMSNTYTIHPDSALGEGIYRQFACGMMMDRAGNFLNGGTDLTYDFTVALPPAAPTLTNPPNGKVTTYQTLNFAWTAVDGASKYQYQISDDNTFASTVQDTEVATNTYQYGVLPYGDTYYWRVRAFDGSWSDWSDTWSVTVNKDTWEPNDTQGEAKGNFDMSSQYQQYVQGYVNSLTDQDWFSYYMEAGQCVRFWINMQYRTKSYDSADMQIVLYKPDGSFLGMNNDGAAYNDPAIKVCVTETGTYTLRAKLEKGALPAADVDRTYQLMAQWLDVPTLTAPANGSHTSDRTPTFRWQAVDLAKIYDIQIARDPAFNQLVSQVSVKTLTYTPTTNLTNDTYYWRVRARNLRYIGDYSDAWTVTIP